MTHFIGIGGIGMSALARILLQKGESVSGSDQGSSELLNALRLEGAIVHKGHDQAHLKEPKRIIYSSAIAADNPELIRGREGNFKILHRGEFLRELMEGSEKLVVAGAHGKTSTSALLSWVLCHAGLDPSFAVGGLIKEINTNGRWGQGSYFVAEVDESDGSFLQGELDGAILTNVDSEHLDYWKTEENLLGAYRRFIAHVKDPSLFFWCYEDPTLRKWKPKGFSYGFSEEADLNLEGSDVTFQGNVYPHLTFPLHGKHQRLNALAVFGMALRLGIAEETIRSAFTTFPGVERRQSFLGEYRGTLLYDDYAHHPKEIEATLTALKETHQTKRLIALFQPHRYTRLRDHFEDFITAFTQADEVIITDVYSAGEVPIEGVSSEALASHVEKSTYLSSAQLPEFIKSVCTPNTVMITLGAGDITSLLRTLS